MVLMKKNILSKLLILFSIVGIIPLVAIAIYSYNKSREALFINVRYDIEGDAKDIASSISHLFNKARSDILLLTVNPAFKRYFLEPEKKSFWLKELEKAFLYLSKIFPDSFDEGCYIISDGREICRVIFDKLAHPTELSIDETRNAFFAPTFTIPEGEVYQGPPYISTDTNRWVIPNSTPIVLPDGRKAAIAHMELNVAYLKSIMKNILQEEVEEGFVMDKDGNIIVATWLDIKGEELFPKAVDIENSESYRGVIERMRNENSGFERILYAGEKYLIAFNPIPVSNRYNENRWSVAVMIPEQNVYATMTPARYMLLVLFGSGIVVIMAVIFGSRVVKPLKKLAEISAELAKGDLTKRAHITGEDELGQLATAFNEMASSLEKDRQKLVKELEVSNVLLKVLGFLISFPNMQDILPRIVDSIRNLIPCDTCSIMLLDEKKEFLTIAGSYGLEEKYIKDVRQRVGDGIAGWVALHTKPLLCKGPIQSNRFRNYMQHEKAITGAICIPIESRRGIIGVVSISTKGAYSYEEDDMRRLMLVVDNLAIAMENARLFEELRTANFETMMALAQALETKDVYTRGHSERIVKLGVAVARRLGLPEENRELLKYAAILHDIGKIGIPDSILNKPGRLTDEEYRLVKEHPAIGAEIVKQVKALEPVASIILQHQERWDGKGYPYGMKGEDIPMEARIISVLDAYDAMTSDRSYRKALPVQTAIAELKRCSGTQFDPKVVNAFLAELTLDKIGLVRD